MKYLKLILTIPAIIWGMALNAQINDSLNENPFENKTFTTNQIIEMNVSDIELSEPAGKYLYGDITRFENRKFYSRNTGDCGNECRRTVSGNYSVKGNKIYLFLEAISFWKECKDLPTQKINKEIGTFIWEKDKNGTIKLTAEK